MALHRVTELPYFWAFVDTSDPTNVFVKAAMHCFYGDRQGLERPRMSYHRHMRENAPSLLQQMDKLGVVGFEYHVRFRTQRPPVIHLMRPELRDHTGNVMGFSGAHCTPLLQPATWNAGNHGKSFSVNNVLPELIDNLTLPGSGHGPAVVIAPSCAKYNEEQASETCFRFASAVSHS
jgi:hypothetical protein